ncbi:PREDICTED: probable 3-hydroxyisobutyrate dehydrogenase, mitochondrial isoform X2 [Tarenaya hassleriana]|uniref:probable 3-hydroxyisobutyrate dehydrogenase, mitochondrial isoform X1 n=1 Tax=Tarenaya hassleriana TaxID=28532 RepID=UPI00053C0D54|nr:PREDICTED: probable 3-hydroxyisobutyrate dehydrogenase, mitochondrial isoform X1 [Tarenaya hassleriana]XP_019057308.1 PREDICTED: probable 3-hydroxyisobutyrate dehydrogenase, mitochondrial isoform X2 [Tarenaya hassleriana]
MAIRGAQFLFSVSKRKTHFIFSPCGSFVRFNRFSSSSQDSNQFQNVGFIGLGNMGSRMANNLIKAGYKVTIHDINRDALKVFSEMGVSTKQTPYEVAEASEVVITMLPSSSHVMNVYTGKNGLLDGGNAIRPALLIDSSTIDPQTTRRISLAVSNCILKEKKDNWEKPIMLDAPVSGGVLAAEASTLTFMVGGPEDAYLASKPIFQTMGRTSIYCGGSGNGSAAKICNNLAMAVSMLGVSEALALGQSLGISASTLTKVFNTSSARCWSSDTYNPVPGVMEGVPSSRDYDGGFMSKLMAKDLNLAAEAAEEAGFRHPLTSQAQGMYTKVCEDGHETRDFSCVFRYFYNGKDEA